MTHIIAATGNEAIAIAMRQCLPEVCAAFPITPSTDVMKLITQFVADGLLRTKIILVESEHSAMSACVGASAAGARVMTASSSQGIALMHEILYVASGMRLPIIMGVANRALSAPINIHGDHSDTMGSRDAGWIQLYAKNAQEAYHTLIQGVRIAETTRLPLMVCFDGFTISHSTQRVEILDDEAVQKFVGAHTPMHSLLNTKHPMTFGAFVLPDYYTEIKYQQREALKEALEIIRGVNTEFESRFGISYGLFETHYLEDAEAAIVVIGSTAGTVKKAAEAMREQGIKAGALRIRAYRPFPAKEIANALAHVKTIGVLDRADAPGTDGGPLYTEIRSALYDAKSRPQILGGIYGLGGRELLLEDAKHIYARLAGEEKTLSENIYVGVRE